MSDCKHEPGINQVQALADILRSRTKHVHQLQICPIVHN